MIKFMSKKRNAIVVSLLLCLTMVLTIPVHAEQTSNTVIGTYGMTGANDFRLSYGKTTGARSTGLPSDEVVAGGAYIHTITIDVPLTIYWYQNCYMNGFLKINTNLQVTKNNGTNILSSTRQYDIEYIPYNAEGTFYSSAYIQTTTTANGFGINVHCVASNFEAHAGSIYTFGWIRITLQFYDSSDEVLQIADELTVTEVNGDMLFNWEYNVNANVSGAIVNALEYEYENGTFSDFMESVLVYLTGLDQNAYDQTQLLSDIYTMNSYIYSYCITFASMLTNIRDGINTASSTNHNDLVTVKSRLATIIDKLEEMIAGSTETEAQSELADSGDRLESAAVQMSIESPNISGAMQSVNGVLSNQNTRTAQGRLFAWLTTDWIVVLLVLTAGLAIVRFVLLGKR